jgi:hypothetical protein
MSEDELAEGEYDPGPYRKVSKKDAAWRQIAMAIGCLYIGEWECAITLAAAAEGQIQNINDGNTQSLFEWTRDLKSKADAESERKSVAELNGTRDWLKHNNAQNDILIAEIEAIFMIHRALNKYKAVHHDKAEEISKFERWQDDRWLKRGRHSAGHNTLDYSKSRSKGIWGVFVRLLRSWSIL